MEMLGAITGLIGAGLQAQAQHDNLMFQYAHFNWEKERANQQDWFAQAGRTDALGNRTAYDRAMNEWKTKLSGPQQEISDAQQKEQLLQLTKDAPAARKVKEAVQQRAYEAREPYHRAMIGYQYDKPQSEDSIRADLTQLMATNTATEAKQQQANLMRSAARLGQGAKAEDIISATNQSLGDNAAARQRALAARNDASKEFAARTALHEEQWGKPMAAWANLMSQGGDMPAIPRSAITDTTGQQQQAMLSAFNQGTQRVGSAFDSLAAAAGKSPDLSSVAKLIAGIGQKKGKTSSDNDPSADLGGISQISPSTYDAQAFYDPTRNDFGVSSYGDTAFG